MADWLWPRGTYNYWKSSFLKELNDAAFETMLEFYSKAPSWQSVVVLEHNGDGAFDRVPEDATAFGHRGWPYNFLITTMWSDPADTEVNVAWTREFFAAMRPYLADAAYVNYLSEMEDEALRAAYGQKYERLAALKAKYDPTNFFSSNHNIRPDRAIGLSA
jgi:FAD/FMN-containing dehydrogenase